MVISNTLEYVEKYYYVLSNLEEAENLNFHYQMSG